MVSSSNVGLLHEPRGERGEGVAALPARGDASRAATGGLSGGGGIFKKRSRRLKSADLASPVGEGHPPRFGRRRLAETGSQAPSRASWPSLSSPGTPLRVSTQRTAWHFFFGLLLRNHGPSCFEVRDEVPLSEEPPRIDYLLLRKTASLSPDDPGETLLRLWPLLPLLSIVELKTIGRPYRAGNLDRLWSYVHAYYADESRRPEQRADLCAVLVVPNRTPTLDADLHAMGLSWEDLDGGYARVAGGLFVLYAVEIDVVMEHQGEDLVRCFGHGEQLRTDRAQRFWAELVGTVEANMDVRKLEGYEEVLQRFVKTLPPEQRLAGLAPEQRLAGLAPEQRLAGLAPEQRLAGLAPEQRLAGLAPEQIVLGLPDAMLRTLSAEFLATLSESARAAIRQRLGR